MTATSTVANIKGIWAIVEVAAQELIQTAEVLYGPQAGADKKTYVVNQLMTLIQQEEVKTNVIPAVIEPAVNAGLQFALGILVERLLNALKIDGTITSGTPALGLGSVAPAAV